MAWEEEEANGTAGSKRKVSYIVDPLESSSSIKIEMDEEMASLLGPFGTREANEGVFHEVAREPEVERSGSTERIAWHNCERCCIKFPLESMLNRHRILSHLYSSATGVNSTRRGKKKSLRSTSSKSRRPRDPNELAINDDNNEDVEQSPVETTMIESRAYICNFCEFTCDKRAILVSHLSLDHDITIVPEVDSPSGELTNFEATEGCQGDNDVAVDPQFDGTRQPEEETKEDVYTCKMCNFICKKRSTLSSHVSRKHTELKNDNFRAPEVDYIPEDCTDDDAPAGRKRRNEVSVASRIYECNSCSFECSNRRTLSSHKRRHHTIEAAKYEIYTCNECEFKTEKKSSLYSHIKRKHRAATSDLVDETTDVYYCNQCDYRNKNKYELKVHVARKHTDDFKFSCDTCDKKFKVKGDLTNHVRFSHREQPVICDVCGKTCLNSNSLYVHQKFAHYKAQYQCKLCKRRMVSQANLDEHMLRQHEKRESVVCEECGKTFTRNSRLKIHMRIHTGDRPYDCKVCGKNFARRTALKQHLLIHTGVRPYICDVCGKAFTQKPGLISHRKCHPGPLPPLPRVHIDHILNDVLRSDS